MVGSKHSIFRDRAIRQYFHRREKDVLPRLIGPPVLVFLWILLGVLLIGLVLLIPYLNRSIGG